MFYTEAIKRTWTNSPCTKLKELVIYGYYNFRANHCSVVISFTHDTGGSFYGLAKKDQNKASRVWHRKKLLRGLRVNLFYLWLFCTYF